MRMIPIRTAITYPRTRGLQASVLRARHATTATTPASITSTNGANGCASCIAAAVTPYQTHAQVVRSRSARNSSHHDSSTSVENIT